MEVKYQDAPRITPSMRSAIDELSLKHLWVVYPGSKSYVLDEKITVLPASDLSSIVGGLEKGSWLKHDGQA